MTVGLQLLEEMQRAKIEVDAYTLTSFVNTAKQDGSPHAIATAYNMFKRAGPETMKSTRLYATMIAALGKASFVDEAEGLLDEAQRMGVSADIAMYAAAMQAVADRAQGPAGYARVRQIHERMLAQGVRDNEVTRRILARLPPEV
jgi:pentatricopeptide repeat protein